jgi:hypothetical protein
MLTSFGQTRKYPLAKACRVGGRAAFTLMEVLIASLVSLLLMGALYVAVDLQLRHEQTAREVVEESTLARALLARISGDISQNVDPFLPPTWAQLTGATSGSGGATSAAAGGSPSSASATGGSSTASGSATASATSATTATTVSAVLFNVGVQGDSSRLLLCTSRLPREMIQSGSDANAAGDQAVVSDLRRVAYWLAGSGDAPLGLARLEVKQATSDDAQNLLSNLPDDPGLIMASEVKSLNFSYFDGSAWQDSWDGTTAGPDGVTPIGAPVAIAVTLGIASSDGKSVKTYRHVVVIPTANGTPASTTNPTSPTG